MLYLSLASAGQGYLAYRSSMSSIYLLLDLFTYTAICLRQLFTDGKKARRRHNRQATAPTASDKDDLAVEYATLAEDWPQAPFRRGILQLEIRKPRKKLAANVGGEI